MRARKRQEGNSLVEFALVLPVLLVIVLGGLNGFLVLKDYLGVAYAAGSGAAEAARLGGNPNGETEAWVRSRLGDQFSADRVAQATITISPAAASYDEPVQVTVQFPFQWDYFIGQHTGHLSVTRAARASRESQ
jgi:Flp pilus assembly protein TadG